MIHNKIILAIVEQPKSKCPKKWKKSMIFLTYDNINYFELVKTYHNNWFWKICTEYTYTGKNVPEFMFPNQIFIFFQFSTFLMVHIFTLYHWAQAGRFEYHQPYKPQDFLLRYKWVYGIIQVGPAPNKSILICVALETNLDLQYNIQTFCVLINFE